MNPPTVSNGAHPIAFFYHLRCCAVQCANRKLTILLITAVQIWNSFCTYNCNYLPHTTFHFYLINFLSNTDFPSQYFFTKNHLVLLKDLVLKKMLLGRAKPVASPPPHTHTHKIIGSNNLLTLTENNFRFSIEWSLNSRYTITYGKMHPVVTYKHLSPCGCWEQTTCQNDLKRDKSLLSYLDPA